jgi:uncharacterized protein YndB with AHSA1/START domain
MIMDTKKDVIMVEAVIHASPQQVWKAWTDPKLVKGWFGSDPNGKVLDAKLDPRPGGNFEISFCDADGTEHTCSGVYREVTEFEKLSFTWQWKSEPGVESFIVVTMVPRGYSTKMQLEQFNSDTGSEHDYIEGWKSSFTKLERMMRLPL